LIWLPFTTARLKIYYFFHAFFVEYAVTAPSAPFRKTKMPQHSADGLKIKARIGSAKQ
jgi:hypothetical protein